MNGLRSCFNNWERTKTLLHFVLPIVGLSLPSTAVTTDNGLLHTGAKAVLLPYVDLSDNPLRDALVRWQVALSLKTRVATLSPSLSNERAQLPCHHHIALPLQPSARGSRVSLKE